MLVHNLREKKLTKHRNLKDVILFLYALKSQAKITKTLARFNQAREEIVAQQTPVQYTGTRVAVILI